MIRMTRFIFSAAAVLIALGACSVAGSGRGADQTAQNADRPGWTGRTFVVGSTSTVGGDAAATEIQQKWQLGRGL